MKVLLASNSPRRRELLKELIPAFSVEPSRFQEVGAGLSAYEAARANACGKAREVFSRFPACAVIGADTVVSLDGNILGKPKDEADAQAMLRALSGRTHTVYTGVCVLSSAGEQADVVAAHVTFHTLSEQLITDYVRSGLPMDKAGAYGIQDGYPLVSRCEGSYSCVVGLPTERLRELLCTAGLL